MTWSHAAPILRYADGKPNNSNKTGPLLYPELLNLSSCTDVIDDTDHSDYSKTSLTTNPVSEPHAGDNSRHPFGSVLASCSSNLIPASSVNQALRMMGQTDQIPRHQIAELQEKFLEWYLLSPPILSPQGSEASVLESAQSEAQNFGKQVCQSFNDSVQDQVSGGAELEYLLRPESSTLVPQKQSKRSHPGIEESFTEVLPTEECFQGVVEAQYIQSSSSYSQLMQRILTGASLPAINKSVSRHKSSRTTRYSSRKASNFCHICARTQRNTPKVACRNLQHRACRKSVCIRCFEENGWDWEEANSPNSSWLCPHCTSTCPRKARCHIYNRTNERRRQGRNAMITKS